jgi:hypothetical protein
MEYELRTKRERAKFVFLLLDCEIKKTVTSLFLESTDWGVWEEGPELAQGAKMASSTFF